jgi:hypothetical protein
MRTQFPTRDVVPSRIALVLLRVLLWLGRSPLAQTLLVSTTAGPSRRGIFTNAGVPDGKVGAPGTTLNQHTAPIETTISRAVV